ncbi:Rha family transcriptional regulator [Acinetobacter baumannii]
MSNLSLQTTNSTPFNSSINTAVSVVSTSTVQTMSSKEIAELTGKEHFHVKRDIEVMLSQLNLDPSNFGCIFLDSMNREQKGYALDKELSICLVSGYNVQLRMAIIKRWNELEAQAQPQFTLPTTFSQALLLAAQLEEQKEQLALQVAQQQQAIEVMQPTVDAYELIAGKKGSMCFQDAYKKLGGIKLKEMKQWMFDKKWIYTDRLDREAISYTYLMNGYLVEKVTAYGSQIRITYKGLAAMARQMKIELNAEDFA